MHNVHLFQNCGSIIGDGNIPIGSLDLEEERDLKLNYENINNRTLRWFQTIFIKNLEYNQVFYTNAEKIFQPVTWWLNRQS